MAIHDSETVTAPLRRRDVLRGAAGLAAAGSVAAGLAAPVARAMGGGQSGPAAAAPTGRADFRLEVDGAAPGALARVQSVAIDDLVIDIRETTTGLDVEYRTYAPGGAHFGKATFRARVGQSTDKDLQQWWNDCAAGKNIRKSISVICLNRDGKEARRYNLLDCFPVRYAPAEFDGPGQGPQERLTVQIGRIELVAVGSPPQPPPNGIAVGIAGAPGTAAAAPEIDRSWESVAGGALALDLPDDGAGCAAHTTTPGHKYIDTLTLRGPLTAGRKALCQWITEVTTGRDARRTVSIAEVARGAVADRRYSYLDCFPTRYVFPTLHADGTGNLYEEVAIKPIRLELS